MYSSQTGLLVKTLKSQIIQKKKPTAVDVHKSNIVMLALTEDADKNTPILLSVCSLGIIAEWDIASESHVCINMTQLDLGSKKEFKIRHAVFVKQTQTIVLNDQVKKIFHVIDARTFKSVKKINQIENIPLLVTKMAV
jgi:hypothetical protein